MKYSRSLFLLPVIVLFSLYVFGPKPEMSPLNSEIPVLGNDLKKIENQVNSHEKEVKHLKDDNQARIVWADSVQKNRTPYSIVYLHGYSASQREGIPIHVDFAKRYGCNLYLSRLYEHGLNEEDPLLDITPQNLLESAKYAVAVGKSLGDKVILMSTSTGGTLSLLIASENPDLFSIITYSPNIDLYDSNSWLLTQPWGLQIARMVIGGKYYTYEAPVEAEKYWTTKYRAEALISLKALIEISMKTETFRKVKQPLFMGYYYKDEEHQDKVVSIKRMLEMFDELGTPENLKRKVSFPHAGSHIIGSDIWSEDVKSVKEETYKFAEEVLGMVPVTKF